MRDFLWGALTMGSAAVALFFLRYWRASGDRLFLFFATAFFVMALNWLGLAFIDPQAELRHTIYLLRLLAFTLIIVGIIDKNRSRSPRT
jgi:predicted small integral membrane protein